MFAQADVYDQIRATGAVHARLYLSVTTMLQAAQHKLAS